MTIENHLKQRTLTDKKRALRERRNRELEMRKAGMSYNQIAKAVGVTPKTIVNDIKALTKPNPIYPNLEIAIDLQRIEMALLPLVKGVRSGDHKSIEQWKRLIDTKHRLLGRFTPEPAHSLNTKLPVKVVSEVEIEKI